MKILLLGADGYYGYPLLNELKKNHKVLGIDNFYRRNIPNTPSLTPILNRDEIKFCDITDSKSLESVINSFSPDTVIHLAEQRSAPYSMENFKKRKFTLENNFLGTLNLLECAKVNKFNIIHIGSIGMYGYENDRFIKEGDNIRNPASAYHLTKEIDSSLFSFYSKAYDINIIDLVQGTIWGLGGRFDYDYLYGTVINRFIVQNLINHPLTIYGNGTQSRSFIHINNSIDCVKLVLEEKYHGYTIINQYTQILTINDIANIIGGSKINLENPRFEKENNNLNTTNKTILDLGLTPIFFDSQQVEIIKNKIRDYVNNVDLSLINPREKWS